MGKLLRGRAQQKVEQPSTYQINYWDTGVTVSDRAGWGENYSSLCLFEDGELDGLRNFAWKINGKQKLQGLANLVVRFGLDVD